MYFNCQSTFYRRKFDRDCSPFHGISSPTPKFSSCECVRADFECDYNFNLDSGNQCQLAEGSLRADPPCLNGQKRLSKGYRKMGNCKNGVETLYDAEIISCTFL